MKKLNNYNKYLMIKNNYSSLMKIKYKKIKNIEI
jgi:hypothetical protein